MYKYLEKSEKEFSFSKNKYLINSERYETDYGTFKGNRIYFKSCYVFDNPLQTFNNIKEQMYLKIVDKDMIPYLEAIFKNVRFENNWKDYFNFFQKLIKLYTFNQLPIKVQTYFYTIFVSSIRGFVFEDKYILDHNLLTNELWDKKYKIDGYEIKEDIYYLYQIKSFTIDFIYENYEDWESVIDKFKQDNNINNKIKVFKVYTNGKKLVYEI